MNWYKDQIEIQTHGKGLYAFTDEVEARVHGWKIVEGMCYLYVQHTSASLVINENYDRTAQMDMEAFMEKLVPMNQPWMRHTLEGADDSSSHLRAMLTPVCLTIPIDDGQLSLGTWQGIYLFEHRAVPYRRHVLMRCLGVN